MQIKTFQASDMAEALRLVKAEFGPDAMILTSKKIRRKGFFGFFTKPYFEVTALLDNRPRANFSEPEPAKEPVKEPNTMEEFQKSMLAPLARELKELRSRVESLSAVDENVEPPPAKRKLPEIETPPAVDRQRMEDLKRFLLRSMDTGKGDGQRDGTVSNGTSLTELAEKTEFRPDVEELKQILLNSMGVRTKSESVAVAASSTEGEQRAVSNSHGDAQREADDLKQLLLRVAGKGLANEGAATATSRLYRVESVAESAPIVELQGDSTDLEFPSLPAQTGSDSDKVGRPAQGTLSTEVNMVRKRHGSEADALKQSLRHYLYTESLSGAVSIEKKPTTCVSEQNHMETMRDLLRANGVGDEEIQTLLTNLMPASVRGETLSQLQGRLREAIMTSITCSKEMTLKYDSSHILAFVGPTGVGKTTTIAKLAALAVKQRVRVAIITIDTYRIGAVDQLKSYAAIMELPFAVAETPDELVAAIDANSDKQLIFINTEGRNPRDQERLLEMKSFFDLYPAIETHLCVAATTRDRELMQIYNRFSILPISRVLFTKLDESESFGCIINFHLKNKVPLSYFTTGQVVPEDLQVATAKGVADLILGEMTP